MLLGRRLGQEAGLTHDGGGAHVAVRDVKRHAPRALLGLRRNSLGLLGGHLVQTLALHKVDCGVGGARDVVDFTCA